MRSASRRTTQTGVVSATSRRASRWASTTRRPAVPQEKVKWNLPEPDSEGIAASSNYQLLGGRISEVEKAFKLVKVL